MAAQPTDIRPLLAVNFAGSLGYTIVMPFLVFLVIQWGGNAVIYGLVGAAYSVFQLFGSPMLGRLSDTWGRKRVLLLSQAGSSASWLLALAGFYVPLVTLTDVDSSLLGKFTLTLPLLLLFLARALDGLTGGDVSVANAYIADISAPDQRKANFGKLAASANAGEVIGPALAGILVGTAMGYELPVLVAAAICFAGTMMIWLRLPEPKSRVAATNQTAPSCVSVATGRNDPSCTVTPKMRSLGMVLRLPSVSKLLTASFLVNLAFSIFYIALPFYVVQELGWSPVKMALFFVLMSLVMVVVEGPVLKRVSKFCSNSVLIMGGGLVLGFGFAMLDTRVDATVFSAAVLIAVGNGLVWPLLVAELSERAGEQQGTVQGLAGGTGAIANIIGLLVGGILYSSLQGWLFIISGLLTFLLTLLVLYARRSKPTRGAVY